MKTVKGISVSGGIAVGPLNIVPSRTLKRNTAVQSVGIELARFEKARCAAVEQLCRLQARVLSELGQESAAIFKIQQMILEDEDYLEEVRRGVIQDGSTAEQAAAQAGEVLAGIFSGMESEEMRARAVDMRDAAGLVVDLLAGEDTEPAVLAEPSILASDEVTPSLLMRLERSKVLGFVTREGSPGSHAAILARGMGIPAMIGIEVDPGWQGKRAVLDGGQQLLIDPDLETLERAEKKLREERERRILLEKMKDSPSVTLDGRQVEICANIGSLEEARLAAQNGAEGVGLFRSELLFLNTETCPSEEEQFAVYKQVIRELGEKLVVIRTLDVGADKQADYLELKQEHNPALGYRGIRVCLDRREMFKSQLRAILRAGAFGRAAVMFPMVASLWEVQEAKKLLEECRVELQKREIPVGTVEVGVMIETPAAVVMADQLAREVSFFSIGTNDLTQYTLAADRENPAMGAYWRPRHPAVLRMIRHVADTGHRQGCRVGICGELAADLELTGTLLEMGIDELSVPPGDVLLLRERVRGLDLSGRIK